MEKLIELLPDIYRILEDILLLFAVFTGLSTKHTLKKNIGEQTIKKDTKRVKTQATKLKKALAVKEEAVQEAKELAKNIIKEEGNPYEE